MRLVKWFLFLLAFTVFVFLGLGGSCGGGDDDRNGDGDDDVDDDIDDDVDDDTDDDTDNCADQSNLGVDEGDTMAEFTLNDENGDPLSLYELCNHVVLIVSSAGWCPACAQEASSIVADIYEPYHDRGLEIYYTLFEDSSGGVPDQAYLRSYKSAYNLPFHVYGDPSGVLFQYQDTYPQIYTPFNIILDKNMVIRAEIAGYFVGTIKYYIETFLEE